MKEGSCYKRLRIVRGEFVEVKNEAEAADVVLTVGEPMDRGKAGAQGALANVPVCSIGDWGLHLRTVADKGGSTLQLGVTDRLGREECCFYVDASSSRKKREIVSLLIRMIEDVSRSAGEGGLVKRIAERCRFRV